MKHSLFCRITYTLAAFSLIVGSALALSEKKGISQTVQIEESSNNNKALKKLFDEFSDFYPVTITAGTGVSDAFLSTDPNATSQDPSGTLYQEGTTIYAFVDLKPGYKQVSAWVHISDSIYRIPNSRVVSSVVENNNFGTHGSAGKYEYNITYNLDGGSLEEENPTTYNVETPTFTLNNPTKTGYSFLGWTGSNGDTPDINVTIEQGSIDHRTYTANYSPDEYSITYILNGGTLENDNPSTYSIETPTFTLNNPTKYGYVFKGWSGTGIVDKSTTVTIEKGSVGNREYVANFEVSTTTVTLSQQGGSGGTTQVTATFGEPMPNITIPKKTDRKFIGYYTANKGTKYYNDDGTSAANWDKTNAKATLYAYYIPNLHVNEVTGTNYLWDGEQHSYETILVQYTDDNNVTHTLYEGEYQIEFSNDGGESYTLNEKPTFSDIGTHTIYYKVSATDLASFKGTITITIIEVDKEDLIALINTVDTYLESITNEYPTIASTLKEVRDEAYDNYILVKEVSKAQVLAEISKLQGAYNNAKVSVVETLISNIGDVRFPDSKDAIEAARAAYDDLDEELQALVNNYATLTSAEETYANLASKRSDEATGVSIQTNDGTKISENIDLKVEIRTSVKAQEGSAEYINIQNKLADDEIITNVYDIKLVQNDGGVETIVQPSDIKEGLKIIVYITLPIGLEVDDLKLLHIHSEDDINFIDDFTIVDGKIVFEVDHFSEIAFVKKINTPTPEPEPVEPTNNGLPTWTIFMIIGGGVLVLLLVAILIVIRIRKKNKGQY